MCGITGGVWSDPAKAIDRAQLTRMTDALAHRGPDGRGEFLQEYHTREAYAHVPGVALGHRRLSIIDLAGGAQPMSTSDGELQLVFNGEIYNYQQLRHRLEGRGHKLQTSSDTETILLLYRDEGLEAFQHLNGMFAIALWDNRERRLVLVRDRLGKKPLVFRYEKERLLFASELKSLLTIANLPREVDPSSIDEFLTYQYVPQPRTILKGYSKLPPGYLAVWKEGRLSTQQYWNPDFTAEKSLAGAGSSPSTISETAATAEIRELLSSAVQLRMQSDVPLGAFLSGGIDSSLIVALMQQHSTSPVKTFTIGFPMKDFDEREPAALVAKHLGTEHHLLEVTPQAAELLPSLAENYDEPFADSSAIPTWYVSQLTKQHVTVALSGDGGDELFAGYARYRAVKLAGTIDRLGPIKSMLASKLWQLLPSSGRQKSRVRQWKRFTESLALPAARRYLDWISIFGETRRAALYHDDFLAQLARDPAEHLLAAWNRSKGRDDVTAATLADLLTYLPGDLMTKVDIASMAHGLEVRAPFLDVRVVEFAASLPLRLKLRGRVTKYLLRQAFGSLLPAAIWKRKKMGFGVPLDSWFRKELKSLTHDLLTGSSTQIHAWIRPEAIELLLREHDNRTFDHSARIWALVSLELWCRRWLAS